MRRKATLVALCVLVLLAFGMVIDKLTYTAQVAGEDRKKVLNDYGRFIGFEECINGVLYIETKKGYVLYTDIYPDGTLRLRRCQ